MKKILFIIALLGSKWMSGQLSVNILLPPGGVMDKQQLWNIIATNTETSPLTLQLQVTFSEVNTGQPVFVASVSPFVINPGTTQLTPGSIGSVFFNIVNPDYQIDPGPNGLLPVGTFMACYDFMISKYNKVVRECQPINIPPLGPLQLVQPANGSELMDLNPMLSWLPPSPINMLNNLRYDLRIVEIQGQQTAADAIKENLSLFSSPGITATNYPYSNQLTPLEAGKKYAWQIIAVNNSNVITKSEVWMFTTKTTTTTPLPPIAAPVYIKLRGKGMTEGYALFRGQLHFDYFNETNDIKWSISIQDLSDPGRISFNLPMDSLKIKRGQNLVDYDAHNDRRFIDGHQYLLKVISNTNETWQLRFEYRKPE
jgi:hypothetical protein